MKLLIISLFLVGCSNISINKDINPEPSEFNKLGMQWERSIKTAQ
jgi:hypothetical protein